MKTYQPDPEKWARYFLRNDSSSKSQVKEGQRQRVIPIENKALNVPNKSEIVRIEAITPVQRQNKRVESELLRIGALKKPSRERKRTHADTLDQRGGSIKSETKACVFVRYVWILNLPPPPLLLIPTWNVSMNTCDICDKTFGRRDNMLRHKRSVHRPEESDTDQSLAEDSDQAESENEETVAKYDLWNSLIQKTFEQCQPQFRAKVYSLSHSRIGQEDARNKAYKELQPMFRKALVALV